MSTNDVDVRQRQGERSECRKINGKDVLVTAVPNPDAVPITSNSPSYICEFVFGLRDGMTSVIHVMEAGRRRSFKSEDEAIREGFIAAELR